jgi:hypothetical protein
MRNSTTQAYNSLASFGNSKENSSYDTKPSDGFTRLDKSSILQPQLIQQDIRSGDLSP